MATNSTRIRVATDIGGTFTDFVSVSEQTGELVAVKAPTTEAPAEGVLDCFDLSGIAYSDVELLLHGTTIVINTLIEGRGARTALITTRGFRDVYEIGRANRVDMYDILYRKAEPLVPRELRLEVPERVTASGDVIEPLDEEAARRVLEEAQAKGVEAIAICLINAYVNPAHERLLLELAGEVCGGVRATASHELVREYREYERTATTAANAYVTPHVTKYIEGLEQAVQERGFRGSLLMMRSNGGTMTARAARSQALNLLESGPAAGVIGAGEIAKLLGHERAISFDMGGTTAKASLVERGTPQLATEYRVAGAKDHPLLVPGIDIVEVGAGGGSIAWIDEGGGLRVGPRSAGAIPGPACYGRGGSDPTVTDANLIAGRLSAEAFLGGTMRINYKAGAESISALGGRLGLSRDEMALGILEIANANMLHAIRAVSIERGRDPREFVLVAFGGGGPMHATFLARELGMRQIVIPLQPGNFSALGMLMTDVRYDYAQTLVAPLDAAEPREVEEIYTQLEAAGMSQLRADGFAEERIVCARAVDMRYVGQEHTVRVPLPGPASPGYQEAIKQRFDHLHKERYGISAPDAPAEMVHLRVTATGQVERPQLPRVAADRGAGAAGPPRRVLFKDAGWIDCPIYARHDLAPDQVIAGPAVVEEYGSTVVLAEGDSVTLTEYGHLLIEPAK